MNEQSKIASNASPASERYSCRTPPEARDLAQALAHGAPKPANAETGLFELLMNAIEHGNLELDQAAKAELLKDDRLAEEIEARLAQAPYRDREVRVERTVTSACITFLITDEGHGFSWDLYESDTDLNRQFGRGIMIARRIGFDRVEYLGCGNQVRATILL